MKSDDKLCLLDLKEKKLNRALEMGIILYVFGPNGNWIGVSDN